MKNTDILYGLALKPFWIFQQLTGKTRRLIITGLFCCISALTQASVQIQIDRAQVKVGESFNLILTQSDLSNGGIPDLVPLQKDFIILGTERRVNYSITNGQTQSSSEWTISLKARKAGTLTIPALKVGAEQTTPTLVDIVANSYTQNISDNPDQQDGIILTTEVNEPKPYVNQQIIYKVTLYNSKHLLDADYQGPQVENALLFPLGEEKRYQTQRNNVNYIVEEQNYAIFPQKSGVLKIKSPTFSALVYDLNPQRVKAQDKTLNLKVQPIPKQYNGKLWLPAKQVKLSDQYENADQTVSQGSTLVRTVTLQGTGIPAQLLPTLNFADTDAFNVYPEKGKDKNQVIQSELIGSTQIKVTYLFNKAGKIIIPELKLPWFNTETGKEEIATLAPRSIEVTPSATLPVSGTPQSQPLLNQNQNAPVVPQEADTSYTLTPDNSGWITATFFALAWLGTLGLWGWRGHSKKKGKGKYKKVLKDLHQTCMQKNPQQARDALLKWASMHWPDAPILNLNDLVHLSTDTHLKKQIQILSQALYKNDENASWHGAELWRCIEGTKQSKSGIKRKTEALPPMNPF